ncbi:MAG: MBL fold metallo-hydrolase [Kiritimatiellae bacterium]|nr:MBL fold metallo-hydrolase [Kiritimatiellia bacterium]
MKPSFVILGARGSMPVSGGKFTKYGGRTTSFCLKTEEGMLIIDAGTGIELVAETADEKLRPAAVLFTHFHLDHVMALPFLKRLSRRQSSLQLIADSSGGKNWRAALANLFAPPYWPAPLAEMGARLEFSDLPAGKNAFDLHGVQVAWCPLAHPQNCLAFRFKTGKKSVAIVTDHESGSPDIDGALLRLCRGVDYLIYDAQWTPEELAKRRGWGHSSWKDGADFARRAGAGELILTHHDYKRSDDEIDAIVQEARRCFPETKAARENMPVF